MNNANLPLPYAEDLETIPADEADDIQRVIQAMELIPRTQAKSGMFRQTSMSNRMVTPKGNSEYYRTCPRNCEGLFEREGVYRTVVRFSNASSQLQADAIPDGRGMAIKVLEVKGEMVLPDEQSGPSQDFLMINHPVFFARNVKDFLRIERVLVEADDNSLATLQGGLTGGDWNPLHWHWREMLAVAQIAAKLPAHRRVSPTSAWPRFDSETMWPSIGRSRPESPRVVPASGPANGLPGRRDALGAGGNAGNTGSVVRVPSATAHLRAHDAHRRRHRRVA